MNESLTFEDGVNAGMRHCQGAIALVRNGTWTLDQMDAWITACLTNDLGALEVAVTGTSLEGAGTVRPKIVQRGR